MNVFAFVGTLFIDLTMSSPHLLDEPVSPYADRSGRTAQLHEITLMTVFQ